MPDLPSCIAASETREEALELIKGAIELPIEGLREAGEPVPPPSSVSEVIEVNAANKSPKPTPNRYTLRCPINEGVRKGARYDRDPSASPC